MPNHYLHIDQGQGGVYTLPTTTYDARGNDRQLNAIGTSDCFTCVGIHVRLNNTGTKCFVAHISADLSPATVALNKRVGRHESHADLYTDEAQAAELYSKVRMKLQKTPELQQWVESTDPFTRAKHVFVVCPISQDPDGNLLTGHHIVQAIKDFFDLEALAPATAHGFCVDHDQALTKANFSWQGKRDMWPGIAACFSKDPSPDSLQSHGWERGNEEAPNAKKWDFVGPWSWVFHDGRWHSGEYVCPGQ